MNPMRLMELINGWKTELGILAYFIVRVLAKVDWIDEQTTTDAIGLIVVWTGLSIKHAIKKSAG